MIEEHILGIEECREEILRFNNDLSVQNLDELYHSKSFSEIFGISRKETSHNNFLAWLLNDKEDHLLSEFALRKLLEIIARFDKNIQFCENKNFFDSVIVSNYKLSKIKVTKEKSFGKKNNKNKGRPDLFIEASVLIQGIEKKLKIVVENKVKSKENNDQTLRYYDYFKKNTSDIILFVYLTPISNIDLSVLVEPECKSKHFIQINYQSILNFILEPLLEKDISLRTKTIINEYIKSLSQPTMEKSNKEHKADLIMALGTEEKELLNNFWDKNQKLIMAALYARSINDELDPEDRQAYSKVIESEKVLKIGEYVKSKFRDLHERNLLDTFEINQLLNEDYSKTIFNVNFSILKNESENISNSDGVKRYYTKEKFCGNYYLTSQWYKKDWPLFDKWLSGIYKKNNIL